MLELFITQSVYRTIETECVRNPHTETGGRLFGTLGRCIAIKATTAGRGAIKTTTSFFNDVKHDEDAQREAIKKYDGHVKSIGFWHKHPTGLRHPSLGDLAEACKIVNDISHEGDARPVFFLIANLNHSLELSAYVLSQDMKLFDEVRLHVIDDNAPGVKEAIECESIIIQPKELDFWRTMNFQWFRTQVGYARLQQEVNELKEKDFKVKAFAGKMLYLIIEKDGNIINCVTPPEYPLNPPRLFENNTETSIVLKSWNSTFMIVDILTQLEKFRIRERRNCEDNHSKAGHLSRIFNPIKKTIKSVWPFAGRRRD